MTLATDRSVTLAHIVRDMDRDSDNYTAELLLKALGASTGAVGSTAAGARVVIEELEAAGVDTSGVRIADGSGLSSLDRLTATALVDVIAAALRQPEGTWALPGLARRRRPQRDAARPSPRAPLEGARQDRDDEHRVLALRRRRATRSRSP